MIHPRHLRLAAQLRREVAEREAQLYGARLADVTLLRQRGFVIYIEGSGAQRRFHVDNRLLSGTELRAVAARERRLLKHYRKGI
jgi:hypothetical protein